MLAVISAGGYGGVALLMAMESACLPLPSEIIMPFAGFLVSTGRFGLVPVAVAGAIGCNLGSAIAYEAGARGGRRFVERYGKYVLATTHDLDLATRFFARFGALAIFIGRLLPLIRTFIALPAGIGHMRRVPFHAYTFVGSFLWCLMLAYIGERLGRAWESDPALHRVMHGLDGAVVLAALAGLGLVAWRRMRKR